MDVARDVDRGGRVQDHSRGGSGRSLPSENAQDDSRVLGRRASREIGLVDVGIAEPRWIDRPGPGPSAANLDDLRAPNWRDFVETGGATNHHRVHPADTFQTAL